MLGGKERETWSVCKEWRNPAVFQLHSWRSSPGTVRSLASGVCTWLYKALSDARIGLFLETVLSTPYPERLFGLLQEEMYGYHCHIVTTPSLQCHLLNLYYLHSPEERVGRGNLSFLFPFSSWWGHTGGSKICSVQFSGAKLNSSYNFNCFIPYRFKKIQVISLNLCSSQFYTVALYLQEKLASDLRICGWQTCLWNRRICQSDSMIDYQEQIESFFLRKSFLWDQL